ncbi:RrF2 family transcriptional regulator [Bilifractor sp. LCP19S3_H10]|uniref:RrF2 family transcriptional regulator n=1 Tax=unclassified Bilifractor TaxID=2815795 RepID=UPI002A857D5C|nr:Rrf2 family transcriptional regulator [Eubacterium sp.]MDY5112232.1 Rrf2 family transcriptional regulator [Bilifractor sp.]
MKISTKGRYALRMMLDIAQHDTGEPVRIKDISARQDISLKYLEQIVSVLVRANYLRSIRGPQGGYRLTKRPEEYVVGDILRLTEGSLSPVECLSTDRNDCPRADSCVTLRIWKELDEAIRSVVDKYTLEDLLNWSEQTVNNFVI